MERFPETIFSNAALAHRRGDDDVLASAAVLTCENCGETAERLTLVPEFEYMGCDDCMEEALAVIEREQRAAMLSEAGCTPAEAAAFIKAVA